MLKLKDSYKTILTTENSKTSTLNNYLILKEINKLRVLLKRLCELCGETEEI